MIQTTWKQQNFSASLKISNIPRWLIIFEILNWRLITVSKEENWTTAIFVFYGQPCNLDLISSPYFRWFIAHLLHSSCFLFTFKLCFDIYKAWYRYMLSFLFELLIKSCDSNRQNVEICVFYLLFFIQRVSSASESAFWWKWISRCVLISYLFTEIK